MSWQKAQAWESSWWGACLNTYGEEEKQLLYAQKMGLTTFHDGRSPYNFNLGGKSVLDVGGGPTSILLKAVNRGRSAVVDPLEVPEWVKARYELANIEFIQKPAEELDTTGHWDEAWIYNCLQHTQDPALILEKTLAVAKTVRIFEWLETRINVGHPHTFTAEWFNSRLVGEGRVETLKGQAHCKGLCYYGVFPGA